MRSLKANGEIYREISFQHESSLPSRLKVNNNGSAERKRFCRKDKRFAKTNNQISEGPASKERVDWEWVAEFSEGAQTETPKQTSSHAAGREKNRCESKQNKKKGAARPTGAEWKETGGGAVIFFAFSISPAFNFSIDVNERFVVTSQYRAFCVRRDLSCRDFFEVFRVVFCFKR